MAVFASAWGLFGVLVLLVLLSYPILLARTVAPEAFSRALSEFTGSQQGPSSLHTIGADSSVGESGLTDSTIATGVREQQWLEWARHRRASAR